MSARNTKPLFDYVERRALRKANVHFHALRGKEAKTAVINGATVRLLTPGKLVKMPPKPGKPVRWRMKPVDAIELLPKQLRLRMLRPLPAPIGNLQLHRSPLDAPLWLAFVKVYQQLFELSPVWDVKGAARVKLVDNAIDATRAAYIIETEVDGGEEKLDPTTHDALGRYTEAGQAFAMEPSREIEQQAQLEAEAAALATALNARKREREAAYTELRQALNAYGRKLRCPKQRRAFGMICNEPNMLGKDIALKCRISEPTVSKRRADFEEMAEPFFALLALAEESVPSDVAPTADMPPDASVELIADAGEVEGAEVDATADLGKATLHSDVLDLAWNLRAPDVDADVSEATLHNYARRNSSNGFGSQWGKGRRMYGDVELTTGSRYGGKYANPAEIALREERERERERMQDYSESEMKAMQEMAAKFGVDLQGLLKSAAVHLALRESEAEQARTVAEEVRKAARHLRGAAFLLDKSADEVADLRAFAEWFCPAFGSSVDELLGKSIRGPKESDQ